MTKWPRGTEQERTARAAAWEIEKAKYAKEQRRIEYQAFFESEPWLRLRYDTLRRFEGVCHCCGCRPSRGNPIQVDHIKPRSKYPKLALDPNNVQILCRQCNIGKGSHDETDWRWV